jgi:organic hydroperoxide reductase OsmC/OhrA
MSASREHRYAARIEWSGAAHGSTKTYAGYSREYTIAVDGKPVLTGSADPAFRGDAAHYNPEDLLLAALSACHLLTYLALCAREGIAIVAYADDATGTMSETGGAGRFTRVLLRPVVEIDEERIERATALHDEAHAECFVANSVNFPVEHEAVVRRAPASPR